MIWCLEQLNLKKSEAVFIGDLEIDLEAGEKAGITTVRIIRGVDNKLLKDPLVIGDLYELQGKIDFINNNYFSKTSP